MTSIDRCDSVGVPVPWTAAARTAARRLRLAVMIPFVAFTTSCVERSLVEPELPPAPPEGEEPAPPPPLPIGVFEFTMSGIGSAEMSGSALSISALTPVAAGLQFELVSGSSFTEGVRGQGGHRYVTFVYRVRNGTGAPLDNVTLIPVTSGTTLAGSPFTSISLFNGSPANPTLANKIVPTGAAVLGQDGRMLAPYADVLQAYEEAEVAAITLPAGRTGIFPYGFVVRSPHYGGRTLPVATDATDFAGTLTFAFRIPLLASSSVDAFAATFQALAVQDSERRMTESIEEAGDTAAVRRLRERAVAIGATTVTVLNGSGRMAPAVPNYPGQRQICSLRTAGTAASPLTFVTEPGPFSELFLLRPNENLDACAANFRSGEPGRPATNVAFELRVRAMDRYGNLRTADTSTVRLEQTGASATMPAPAKLVAGQRTVTITYTDYGTSQVTAVSRPARGWQTVPVFGVTRVWTAGAGTTNWSTGGNWQHGAVPMHLDSVHIPNPPLQPFYPVLVNNVSVQGVLVDNGATISLGPFDLSAGGNVATGTSGGIDGATGRLMLTGVAKTVRGNVPRVRVSGTYSLDGNLTARAPLRVESGRLRSGSFRIRATSF
jgi:hypothetical protein